MKTKNLIAALLLIAAVAIPTQLFAASFDMPGLGASLNGWKKKGGTAAEFKSADSSYRTNQPTVTATPDGGLLVSTKLDHIRGGGGDDHCLLEMTFDSAGKIVSSQAKMEMGDKKFDTGIVTSAAGGVPINKIGEGVLTKLADQVARWGESGGRANFPAVVRHNMIIIASAVRP